MLDRDDVAGWIEALAAGGKLSRRSVQICRTVLRAALTEAVDEGLIARSPAARVGLPRGELCGPAGVHQLSRSAVHIEAFQEIDGDLPFVSRSIGTGML